LPRNLETGQVEPTLTTAPHLLAVLDELRRREPIFHRPEQGTARTDFEAMTDLQFWEVGASGRRYSREFILETLDARRQSGDTGIWETTDFHCREIAAENYLVTYTLLQGARVTRRCTLWRRSGSGWKILYHQGTLVDPAA
jgi:hypothetical protein